MPSHRRRLAGILGARDVRFGAAWLAVVLAASWGGWQVWQAESPHTPPPALPVAMVGQTAPPAAVAAAAVHGLGRSAPVKISIASIKLRASVDQVGLAADGTLEEQPFARANNAAWYRLGPAPGQVGPAVIVGHVDTKSSVAVFFYLSQVRPGAKVVITRADGHVATFTVDGLASYPKANFPTKLVYGPTAYPALRLVTCGGTFDRSAGSYLNNIVVFAHLTSFV